MQDCGVVNRTIQAAGCKECACFICQVAVQGAAQSQDVNGFLFRAVEEVVLDGSGDRTSSVFKLSTLQENTRNKSSVKLYNVKKTRAKTLNAKIKTHSGY